MESFLTLYCRVFLGGFTLHRENDREKENEKKIKKGRERRGRNKTEKNKKREQRDKSLCNQNYITIVFFFISSD